MYVPTGIIDLRTLTAGPAAPGAGRHRLFVSPNGMPLLRDPAGNERLLTDATWPRIRAGKWHLTAPSGNIATLGATINRPYAMPFIPPRDSTLTGVAAAATTAGGTGSVMRLGLYGSNDGEPAARIADFGTIDTTTTTVKTLSPASPPPVAAGVIYFVVAVLQVATATVRSSAGADPLIPDEGTVPSMGSAVNAYYSTTTVSGALPDPYPLTGLTAAQGPRIGLRFS